MEALDEKKNKIADDIDLDKLLPTLSDDEIEDSQNPGEPSVLETLKVAWLNERGSPELLDYEGALVSRVKEELETQQELIEQSSEKKGTALMVRIYQMEIERINFILKSYLRTRLWKMEKHIIHILSTADMVARLSPQEVDFCKKYADLIEKNFNTAFLRHLPEQYSQMTDKDMVVLPNLDEYVFCRANSNIGTISFGVESGETSVSSGDILVASYRPLKELVKNGMLQLI